MTATNHTLRNLVTAGVITDAERIAAQRLFTLAGTQPEGPVAHALALAVRTQRTGDVCVDLHAHNMTHDVTTKLAASPLVTDRPATHAAPFVLAAHRLYLQRNYQQEQRLAQAILHLANATMPMDTAWLATQLHDLFGPPETTTPNRQRLAVAISILRQLAIIAGGPGSGKTFTVSRILTVLQRWQQHTGTPPLNVVLAAPTGRAAARLTSTINQAGLTGNAEAMTLHRLLHRRLTHRNARDGNRPLDADVVIVDEASMVGLPLFASLLDALKPSARLILLGDSNQLGAIDTGAVFHELCGPDTNRTSQISAVAAGVYSDATREPVAYDDAPEGIRDVVVRLNVTHRFDETGGVGRAAELLRDVTTDSNATVTKLQALHGDGFAYHHTDAPEAASRWLTHAVAAYNDATNTVLHDADPLAALERFDDFRVLCAVHDGPNGTRSWNTRILTELARINPHVHTSLRFHPGRFVLVTRNDHATGVQNGDVGVIVADTDTRELQVAFATGSGSVNYVSPYRLSAPEDPYAMSVHKAQGSQFATVLLALPEHATPVASRALVYTAVTRARTAAAILDPGGQLGAALAHVDTRASGLSATLWPAT